MNKSHQPHFYSLCAFLFRLKHLTPFLLLSCYPANLLICRSKRAHENLAFLQLLRLVTLWGKQPHGGGDREGKGREAQIPLGPVKPLR